MGPVRELRVAVTAEDYEEALRFYRDALGLPVIESWENEGGSGAILDAGRATLEVLSRSQVDYVDEIEAGGQSSGPVRFALEADDFVEAAERSSPRARNGWRPGRDVLPTPQRAAARARRHAAHAVHVLD
jgi:catechol 2,3-dioxygenase-like lactoylglutathione lyase family enzyme